VNGERQDRDVHLGVGEFGHVEMRIHRAAQSSSSSSSSQLSLQTHPQWTTGRSVGRPSTVVCSQKFFFHSEFDIELAEIVVSTVMVDETPVTSQEVIDK
jgi:hypothetical protein